MKYYWVLEVSFWSIFYNLDNYFIKNFLSTAFCNILLENIWKRSNKTLLLDSTVDFFAKPSRLGTRQHIFSNLFSPYFWFMASKFFFQPFKWLSENKNPWIGPFLKDSIGRYITLWDFFLIININPQFFHINFENWWHQGSFYKWKHIVEFMH